jgi:eukaryotic-like serine/threonine-protein kinase
MSSLERSSHLSDAITAPHLDALQACGFVVRHTVAAGPFGVVYRAFDMTNRREVAVKVIDLDAARPMRGVHSEAEIESLASLRHPHVVPLYSSGELDGAIRYFVMPWIEGESLRARLRAEGRMSLVDALRVGVGVADALVALHARGLIHRDVKPENILFDGRHAVLIDFGLVCAAHPAATTDDDLDPVVGTPAYMAPEQWYHGAALDGRADVFGLGALLYEALTGVSPSDEVRVTRQSRTPWRWSETQPTEDETSPYSPPTRPTVALRERRKDAPERLERLLRQALRMDPAARLTSHEFRDALETLLADQLARSGTSRWLRTRP